MIRKMPAEGEYYLLDGEKTCRVLAVARHTETMEELVILALPGNPERIFAMPLPMFMNSAVRRSAGFEKRGTTGRIPGAGAEAVEQERTGAGSQAEEQERTVPGMRAVEQERTDAGAEAGEYAESWPEVQPEENSEISPDLLLFLEAESPQEKLDVLHTIRNRLTHELIDSIAVSLDTEIREGEMEDRIEEIRSCLLTRIRFEGRRLRGEF